MGGEIEGDGDALLAGGEVAAVEGVRVLGGGEAGILPDRPGPLHIHGGVGAAEIGRHARQAIEEVEPRNIVGAIDRLDGDPLGRLPSTGPGRLDAGAVACVEIDRSEGRDAGHALSLS